MFDSTRREIHYLRLSVTDLCNLRCRYCMPDGVEKLEREAVLTYEEFLRLAALFAQCGIDTVRVTGGEPLVRKNVAQLVAGLKATPGIRRVTLTTNAVLLAEQLPGAQILNEDGSNREFLLSEGLESTEAFVALTNIDEENVLLTLFAKKHSKGKLVTKVNRLEFDDILAGLDLGSIVYPKYMTCDYIVQYVRALQNEAGNNIKTLYRILDDRVEALEFTVHEESKATGVPLSQLHLKKNLLLCCIMRGSEILIPRGGDEIKVGDNVIVVTLEHGLHDLRDIVQD